MQLTCKLYAENMLIRSIPNKNHGVEHPVTRNSILEVSEVCYAELSRIYSAKPFTLY